MAKNNKSFKEINALASKIQASGGKKTVTKTIYKMNRNEAVKEARQTLGFDGKSSKKKKKGGK